MMTMMKHSRRSVV